MLGHPMAWGKPSDLAGIAVYLASAESAFHTGDVITVDGGFACRDPLDPRGWGAGPVIDHAQE